MNDYVPEGKQEIEIKYFMKSNTFFLFFKPSIYKIKKIYKKYCYII